MSEYKVEAVYFSDEKFILKAPDGRVLSMVYPDRKPLDYAANVLNAELEVQWMRLKGVQAELGAAQAEITRLRKINQVMQSAIEMSITYLDDGNDSPTSGVFHAMSELESAMIALHSSSATDVTLNDDTQKLPELDEQLPFDGSPEHTPKFKVGDKVICTDFYGKETIMWITSIDDSPTVMNGVVIPEQGVTMRLENEHESTILHESFLRHAD